MKLHSKFLFPAAVVVLLAGMALGPVVSFKSLITNINMSYIATGSPWVRYLPNGLPPLDDENPYDKNLPFYSCFLDMGDGQYYMTNDTHALRNFYYAYTSNGNKTPFLEVAYAYDKDKKKKQNLSRMSNSGGNAVQTPFSYNSTSSITASMPQASFPVNTYTLLKSTQAAVPDTFFTVVLTYKNPGTVTGPYKLEVKYGGMTAAEPRPYNHNGYTVPTGTPNTMIFDVPAFSTNEPQQRNIILHFYPIQPAPLLDFPTVQLSAQLKDNAGAAIGAGDTLIQPVVNSHDPNIKMAYYEKLCPGNKQILYMVCFQNNGIGDVDSVLIKDELDHNIQFPTRAQLNSTFRFDDKLSGKKATGYPWPNNSKKELVFKFKNIGLKGTGNPRYGIDYGYESTISWVTFVVNVAEMTPCGAICNNARIFFDANTPIETGTNIAPIGCSCVEGCHEVQDTFNKAINLFVPVNGGPSTFATMFPSVYNRLANGFARFKWYPSQFVTEWDELNTSFTAQRPMTYTLVATSAYCERYVFQFYCDYSCFNLSTTAPVPLPCANALTSITAQVSGSLPANYLWSNGARNTPATTFANLPAGNHYIGVTDTLTGCSKEIKVNISAPPPIYIQDDPTDCWARLFVSGGRPGYSYQWNVNGAVSTTNIGKKALRGATAYTVTVTDANGCTAVFNGSGNPVCPRTPISDYQLALLAGSLAVASGFIIRMLVKK